MQTANCELIRNANIVVNPRYDVNNHPIVTITIDDKYEHTFNASSRVSKALEVLPPEDLATRLSGGQYMIVNDTLYDFRDGHYSGFVHTDKSIVNLANHIGITEIGDRGGIRIHENTVSNKLVLGTKWSDHDIVIPSYQTGGEFRSELYFGWSPFIKTVNSVFMIYRLVCTNGMRGMRNFMNTKIPLVNRWEEHLNIANRQIQNKVSAIATNRYAQMGNERATVAELSLLVSHATKRLDDSNETNPETLTRLRNIITIADPKQHLSNIYKDAVFDNGDLAAQHVAHLTTFDAYNMSTELRSHTKECDRSSNRALDNLSNDLVFDRKNLTTHVSRYSGPKLSTFSSPDAAFFGVIQ